MSHQAKWTERKFDFGFPDSDYPQLIARLQKTPSTLADLLSKASDEILVRRDGESWSIQENAGHLIDVESLFEGRLEDYAIGAEVLRPAEMTGRATYEADYNRIKTEEILERFRTIREAYVQRLESMKPEAFGSAAMHPRLNKVMRLCDMLLFQAEHDDYHLNRIQELISRYRSPEYQL
ncbi:DinB family protein [Acidobacteriota bacterium]